MSRDRYSAVLIYHFFHPDDVVSARHFTDLALGLTSCNWDITVLTSNRYCRYRQRAIPLLTERWNNINIIRVKRPDWNQSNDFFRLLNSAWMITAWFFVLLKLPKPNVIVLGSDPQFCALLLLLVRCFNKSSILVHWCFDLYPEAIVTDKSNWIKILVFKPAVFFMRQFYKKMDVLADIGPCMKRLLKKYNSPADSMTFVPWALAEPPEIPKVNLKVRRELFGEDAELTLLYSGNLGKAHDYLVFLNLARQLIKINSRIRFCFSCRGNRLHELTRAISSEDRNIKIVSFACETELMDRLTSADIHLLSLREEWSGIVIPSKFFGSLAVGRPVIYAGNTDSSIAQWIRYFKAGWVVNQNELEPLAKELVSVSRDRSSLSIMQTNAFMAYQKHFSKTITLNKWDIRLREKVAQGLKCY